MFFVPSSFHAFIFRKRGQIEVIDFTFGGEVSLVEADCFAGVRGKPYKLSRPVEMIEKATAKDSIKFTSSTLYLGQN